MQLLIEKYTVQYVESHAFSCLFYLKQLAVLGGGERAGL